MSKFSIPYGSTVFRPMPRPRELSHYIDTWWAANYVGVYAVRLDSAGLPSIYRVVNTKDEYRLKDKPLKWDTSSGYPRVTLSCAPRPRKRAYVHRLVWESIIGMIGPYEIDHKDGDVRNPRLGNLGPVSKKEHAMISALRRYGSPRSNSCGSRCNISRTSSGRYIVRIRWGGVSHRSPTLPTPQAALDWRRRKALELFGCDPFHPDA